ncbi:MAG TPA: hypothetical protein PK789_00305 [Thermomonas sp.]|jgi:hypothetical protein|uniref:hypothetical protein n=1 Tax=Thermomonas sp. TaxID=1971895 RepID=UPI002B54DD07|nr:hypothetical protein [Thermomonas sp.]HOV95210.1 hypothetical protein [Thermomonas sp.]
MSLAAQRARVAHAELVLAAHRRDAVLQTQRLHQCWRAKLTPGRIVLAGLAVGFLVGRARPLQFAGSGGVLNLLRSLSTLLADAQAQLRAAAAATETPATVDADSAATPDAAHPHGQVDAGLQ